MTTFTEYKYFLSIVLTSFRNNSLNDSKFYKLKSNNYLTKISLDFKYVPLLIYFFIKLNKQRSLIPPCQDPAHPPPWLRTDKDCAALANMLGRFILIAEIWMLTLRYEFL